MMVERTNIHSVSLLQINVLDFIIKCDLASYTQLVYWILLCRIAALMLVRLLLMLVLVLMLVAHVVLHAALLCERVAVAAKVLERMRRKHRVVNSF
jgi:hypothetical protein